MFYMGMQNGSKLEIVLCPTLCEWAWLRPYIHINVTTFTRFVQNCNNIIGGSACIVWVYYACSYTVSLSQAIIPSFAMLHTKSLLFSVQHCKAGNKAWGS